MKDLTARYVRATDSLAPGMLDGWYAMSAADVVCSGSFVSQAACEAHIARERSDINAYHQGAANQH